MNKTGTHKSEEGGKKERFYVYSHIDPRGNVFYVGKGTGDRAVETHKRNELWQRYVDKFDGKFRVDIIADGLSENQALSYESSLMEKYGGQLVNVVNMHRSLNYEVMDKIQHLIESREVLEKEAREAEKQGNLEKAVLLYRQALQCLQEWHEATKKEPIEQFAGLAMKVNKEMLADRTGKVSLLNRLTLCLNRLGRKKDIKYEIERYLSSFPAAKHLVALKKIERRVAE